MGLLLSGCGGTSGTEADTRPSSVVAAETPSRLFGSAPQNPFIDDVRAAPVRADSTALVANLVRQIQENDGYAVVNTRHHNLSYVIAGRDTPRHRLGFDDCQDKGSPAPELYGGPRYFVDVPVPADAKAAEGSDGHLAIWSSDTGQLWEFWQMKQRPDGTWSACWGGRIDDPAASGGAYRHPFGVSASGLAAVGSMVTLAEARAHRIDHAVALGLKRIAVESRTLPPATRSDGTDASRDAIPMGARFRLDPSVDVDALGLTPFGTDVARAAQRHGFIVAETAGVVGIAVESGRQEEASGGVNPWDAIFGSTPDYFQLKGFPWDRLQVVDLPTDRSSTTESSS